MKLDRMDNPPPGAVSRLASQKIMRLADFYLELCDMLLNEACPHTPDALVLQGTALTACLSSLRKKVYQHENSEPDVSIVEAYQLKKSDMTDKLSQHLEINEGLAIFNQDPISIINTTFAISNQDQSSLLNDNDVPTIPKATYSPSHCVET